MEQQGRLRAVDESHRVAHGGVALVFVGVYGYVVIGNLRESHVDWPFG
ncbi:hypothetical protein [Nesterenkonia pannonica]|nr:hypothetical protein [Nesterenkonia pannonica]